MRNFPKIALSLLFLASLFLACNKETITPQNTQTDTSLFEEVTIDESQFKGELAASERGICSPYAVSVSYEGFMEYEFDVNLGGYATLHFASNKSGTTKVLNYLPIAVQPRLVTLSNKPLAKQNPKCPWISKEGIITIKVFQAAKNTNGTWVPIKDTPVITYELGAQKPDQISKWGTRTYCVDKPIAQWYFCSLSN